MSSGNKIYVQQFEDATKAQLWSVTSDPTDNTGWWTIPVSLDDEAPGGVLIDGKECLFLFVGVSDPDKIYRQGHTYAISGEIQVPSGDTNFILPFFVSLAVGQTANIVKARYSINSGTSVTAKLQRNGGDITGYTGISVTTTPAETVQAQALSNNDEIALVVTAVAGTPLNMNFTIFIENIQ